MKQYIRYGVSIFFGSLLLSGCATPKYTGVNYNYMAPPEYELTNKHKSISYTVKGENLDRRFERINVDIPELKRTNNSDKSDIVVDISIGQSEFRKGNVKTKQYKNLTGDKEVYNMYSREAGILTPYNIDVFDRVKNDYITKDFYNYNTSLTSPEYYTVQEADNYVRTQFKDQLNIHRSNTAEAALSRVKKTLSQKFKEHKKTDVFRVAFKYEKEPRLQSAYAALTGSKDIKEGARKAMAIYQAIGTNNVDEDGDPDTKLNEAVAQSIRACQAIIAHQYKPI